MAVVGPVLRKCPSPADTVGVMAMDKTVDRQRQNGADTPLVRLANVSKSFGSVRAVDSVSLDIMRGELFCLLGGSGCGKSTLLRIVAGLEQPTDGHVLIDGQDMTDVPSYDRPTNIMFQSYALFPHMSVGRNVAYGLQRAGVGKEEIRDRVADILAMVRLQGMETRKPHQLSGGQRQRVALARALVKRPKLLLLDEPLAALDKKLREETQFELIKLQQTLGVTFIVVTHDQEEAMTLATRIGVMRDGRIEQVSRPRDIYEFPINRFVADFVGSANLFEGTVIDVADDRMTLRCDGLDSPIKTGSTESCAMGQRVWFSLRPEKPTIAAASSTVHDNTVQGVIEDIAYRGDRTIYRVLLPGGRTIDVTRTNQTHREQRPIAINDSVFVCWDFTSGIVLTS